MKQKNTMPPTTNDNFDPIEAKKLEDAVNEIFDPYHEAIINRYRAKLEPIKDMNEEDAAKFADSLMERVRATSKVTKTNAELQRVVDEQQKRIAELQDGYLQLLGVIKTMATDIKRLQKHTGYVPPSIIIPTQWHKTEEIVK